MTSQKERECIEATVDGFEMLLQASRFIALLPLEDWIKSFDQAVAAGGFGSELQTKASIIRSVIEGALPLKDAYLKSKVLADELVLEMRKERKVQ